MLSAISSALSGIRAFIKKTQVTSNNLSNVLTDDFKKSRVTMQEGKSGGVDATIEKVNTPGYPVAPEPGITAKESSNVDIAEEMTNLILAEKGYKANIKTIKAEDENLGTILNMKA